MIDEILRRTLVLLLLFVGCTTAFAQEAQEPQEAQETKKTTSAEEIPSDERESTRSERERDSHETRQKLINLLQRQPSDVARVLKLDPTLWTNETYLKNYPALAAFVKEYPEVTHSPSFYLDWVKVEDPVSPGYRLWEQIIEIISVFGGFLFFAVVLTWLIRTLIEHRRWSRLTKTQAEVHTKLLDRFGTNEELINYIQTPAGRKFLESAPIPLEQPAQRPVSAPIGRILLSVQAGLVALAGGIGFRVIAFSVQKEAAEPIAALGTLAVAIGIGLVVSAAASFFLSRRLGLWRDTVSADTTASE